jgi:hypothetical protein
MKNNHSEGFQIWYANGGWYAIMVDFSISVLVGEPHRIFSDEKSFDWTQLGFEWILWTGNKSYKCLIWNMA